MKTFFSVPAFPHNGDPDQLKAFKTRLMSVSNALQAFGTVTARHRDIVPHTSGVFSKVESTPPIHDETPEDWYNHPFLQPLHGCDAMVVYLLSSHRAQAVEIAFALFVAKIPTLFLYPGGTAGIVEPNIPFVTTRDTIASFYDEASLNDVLKKFFPRQHPMRLAR